jgi:hypothetical protein
MHTIIFVFFFVWMPLTAFAANDTILLASFNTFTNAGCSTGQTTLIYAKSDECIPVILAGTSNVVSCSGGTRKDYSSSTTCSGTPTFTRSLTCSGSATYTCTSYPVASVVKSLDCSSKFPRYYVLDTCQAEGSIATKVTRSGSTITYQGWTNTVCSGTAASTIGYTDGTCGTGNLKFCSNGDCGSSSSSSDHPRKSWAALISVALAVILVINSK